MNDSNLIPMNQRTESEQREITRKGGIESGKARRRKKTLKDISKMFLNARADDCFTNSLKAAGFEDDEMTNAAAIIVSLADEVFANGSTKAAELLFKYAGEDPDQQRKDAELKLKRELLKQQTRKLERFNDVEDLTPLADLLKENEDAPKVVLYVPDDGRGGYDTPGK